MMPLITDLERAEALEIALRKLDAAIGQARLYGNKHPETRKSAAEFTKHMSLILAVLGSVQINATREGLYWGKFSITQEREDHRGIGKNLHAEGISSLTFISGIRSSEVLDLVTILRINLTLPEYEEESLEWLLWQQEFKHIGFSAFSELMDAEALSGRAGLEHAYNRANSIMSQNLELRDFGRKNLRILIRDDDLVRSIQATKAKLHKTLDDQLDYDDWDQTYQPNIEDETLTKCVHELHKEKSEILLARMIRTLLIAAINDRDEFGAEDAYLQAKNGLEQVYSQHAGQALAQVLDSARRLLVYLTNNKRYNSLKLLQNFYRNALPAHWLAPLFLAIDGKTQENVLNYLVRLVPQETLLEVFSLVYQNHQNADQNDFLFAVGRVARDRLRPLLDQNIPIDQFVPLVRAFALANDPKDRAFRKNLLASNHSILRVEAIKWYEKSWNNQDVDLIVAMLMDSHASVRRATQETLRKHRPQRAAKRLQSVILSKRFHTIDSERKRDLAIAFGMVAREKAVKTLHSLFATKIPIFNQEKALEFVEAGAAGLAAVGSPNALQILRKAAGALLGSRRNIAERVLRKLT